MSNKNFVFFIWRWR